MEWGDWLDLVPNGDKKKPPSAEGCGCGLFGALLLLGGALAAWDWMTGLL